MSRQRLILKPCEEQENLAFYLFQSDDSELKHAFCIFDKNGDGYISRSELKEALANLGEDFGDDEIEFMIKEADTGRY